MNTEETEAPESAASLEDFAEAAERDFAELVALSNALAQRAEKLSAVLRIRPNTSGFLVGRARYLGDMANDLRSESAEFATWLRGEPKKSEGVLMMQRENVA